MLASLRPVAAAQRQRLSLAYQAAIVFVSAIAIAAFELRFWRVWRAPLVYSGDANSTLMFVKSIMEGGWIWNSDRLNAPFGQEVLDYPTPDHLQYAYFKVMGWISGGDALLAVNFGYLLGFGIIAVAAFVVIRKLGGSPIVAAGAAILFSVLPYHFWRNVAHLFLANYWAVPLGVLLIVRQMRSEPAGLAGTDSGWRWAPRSRLASTLLLVVVIGFSGFYYAAFTVVLLVSMALLTVIVDKDWRRLLSSMAVAALLGFAIVASVLPMLAERVTEGPNPAVAERKYWDVEYYALKPIQLILPQSGHPIGVLARMGDETVTAPTQSESGQNLGAVGSIALILLLAGVLAASLRAQPVNGDKPLTTRLLGLLIAISLLLASTAGFGALLGLAGLTQLRTWNRMSLFIAFAALAGGALMLDRLRLRLREATFLVVTLVIVAVGVFDQVPTWAGSSNLGIAVAWESDADFVSNIERTLGDGAAVFQLPYLPFPESGPINLMTSYDHARGFLHSDELRWSFGGVQGRETDWQRGIDAMPATHIVAAAAAAGFSGLYIDRFGYADGAAALEAELKQVVGDSPVQSLDGRLLFFDIREIEAVVDRAESSELAELITPVQVGWGPGVTDLDPLEGRGDALLEASSTINFVNPGAKEEVIVLAGIIRNDSSEPALVTFHLEGGPVRIAADEVGGVFEVEIAVPVGASDLELTIEGPGVGGGELRSAVLFDLEWWDPELSPALAALS